MCARNVACALSSSTPETCKLISEFKDYLLSKPARVTHETWERESALEGHCCHCLKERKLEVGILMVQMPLPVDF